MDVVAVIEAETKVLVLVVGALSPGLRAALLASAAFPLSIGQVRPSCLTVRREEPPTSLILLM